MGLYFQDEVVILLFKALYYPVLLLGCTSFLVQRKTPLQASIHDTLSVHRGSGDVSWVSMHLDIKHSQTILTLGAAIDFK